MAKKKVHKTLEFFLPFPDPMLSPNKTAHWAKKAKAKKLYEYIDSTDFYKNNVNKIDRSIMNVTFVTGDADLDKKFAKEAAENGLSNLKGHRLVGGMRASIYNAMPMEGVDALIDFMKKFETENR